MARLRIVTPSYFQVTGMAATRGRLLADGDAGSHLVVVNDAFLASVLPSGAELGRRVGGEYEWTVVGVTRPVRQHDVNEEILAETYVLFDDLLELYPSSASQSMQSVYILAETTRGVPATLQIIRTAVADQMPEFTIRSAAPVMDLIRSHMGRQRLVAAGAVVFAVISLLLAALGLYAMVSQDLALRGREIGIRMALGATVRRIALDSARPIGIVYAVGVCMGTALLLFAMCLRLAGRGEKIHEKVCRCGGRVPIREVCRARSTTATTRADLGVSGTLGTCGASNASNETRRS